MECKILITDHHLSFLLGRQLRPESYTVQYGSYQALQGTFYRLAITEHSLWVIDSSSHQTTQGKLRSSLFADAKGFQRCPLQYFIKAS